MWAQVCTELCRKEEEESESTILMKTAATVNCGGEAHRSQTVNDMYICIIYNRRVYIYIYIFLIASYRIISTPLATPIGWFPKQAIHPQASDKLMNGINGEKLDNFLKLRSYQKEAAVQPPTVLGGLPKPKPKPKSRAQSHGSNIDMSSI